MTYFSESVMDLIHEHHGSKFAMFENDTSTTEFTSGDYQPFENDGSTVEFTSSDYEPFTTY